MTAVPEKPAKPRRRFARILVWTFVVIVFLAIVLTWASWIPLRRSRDAWRAGRNADAIAIAQQWARLPMWQAHFDQLLAAEYLSVGDRDRARPHLTALHGSTILFPVVEKDEVAHRLFARGRYDDFLAYDTAVRERSETAPALLDRAAALAAVNRVADAEAALKSVPRDEAEATKVAALEQAIAARKSGSYPLVFDRAGHAIAAYQIANADLVTIDRQFAPLLEKNAGALTVGAHLAQLGTSDSIDTSLDADVQRAALTALGGFRASLVAIDPRTNEVLAIASNAGSGPVANLALEQQYEPGSIVKVLTGMNALSGGVDMKSFFPYDCKGDLVIDGRHFADWLPAGHGVLPSINEALAVSCNIVFGDLGTRLGADRVRQFMTTAGFNGQTNIDLFEVPLGKIIPPVVNRYDTASLAIGLEHETITALHVAMLASMMANRGVLTSPRLLRGRRSILGEVVVVPARQTSVRVAPANVAETMIGAMKAVVADPQGTGKRAAIDGLTIAMKTGTAGPHGHLSSVILAFAPADQPKIAFGMIAEDAGPAEFAGAKISRDFLEAIVTRLK